MAMPTIGSVAQRIYDLLAPLHHDDEVQDFDLAVYAGAMGLPYQGLEDLAVDDGEVAGWARLFDPQEIPAEGLAWQAQLIGVRLDAGWTEQQQRDAISARLGWERGTPAAMAAAPGLFLSGAKTVIFRERHPTPYSISVLTRLSEMPVEEWPTTNLYLNGGFETNTTGWALFNTATIARSTLQAKYGSASLAVTCGVNNDGAYRDIAGLTPGSTYSVSIWVRADAGETTRSALESPSGTFLGYLLDDLGNANVNGDGTWIRVKASFVAGAGGTARLIVTGQSGAQIFYIDGAQLEANSQATPYVETDGAIASRSAGTVNILKAILSQKPAGIVLTYNALEGQDYQLLFDTHGTYQLVYDDYATYQELIEDA